MTFYEFKKADELNANTILIALTNEADKIRLIKTRVGLNPTLVFIKCLVEVQQIFWANSP